MTSMDWINVAQDTETSGGMLLSTAMNLQTQLNAGKFLD